MLSSVAALALIVGGEAVARTFAPNLDRFPGWYFSVEGGAVTTSPAVSTTISSDKSGTVPILGTENSGYGAFTLGHSIHDSADWRIRLAHTGFENAATTDPAGTYVASVASKLSFTTADFEFGFHPTLPPANDLRLFAGLRALSERDSASASSDKSGDSSRLAGAFAGIGPRAGADFAHRWADGRTGISVNTSAAAIFGSRQSDSSKNGVSASWSADQAIYTLDGAFSFDFLPTAQTKFSVGVRAEKLWNLRGVSTDPALTTKPDLIDWGPFLKFSWSVP